MNLTLETAAKLTQHLQGTLRFFTATKANTDKAPV